MRRGGRRAPFSESRKARESEPCEVWHQQSKGNRTLLLSFMSTCFVIWFFSSFWLQDSFCILFTAPAIYSLDLQLHVMPSSQSLYFNSKCLWRNVIDPGCIRQHLLSNQSRSEGGGNMVQTWLLMGGLTLCFEVGKGISREGDMVLQKWVDAQTLSAIDCQRRQWIAASRGLLVSNFGF